MAVLGIVLATILGTLIGRLPVQELAGGQDLFGLCRSDGAAAAAVVLQVRRSPKTRRARARPTTRCQGFSSRTAASKRLAWKAIGRLMLGRGAVILFLGPLGQVLPGSHRQVFPLGRAALGLIIVLPVLGWLVSGAAAEAGHAGAQGL